jgi:hypothetical protein
MSRGGAAIGRVVVRGLTLVSCRVATEAGDVSDHWPVVAVLERRGPTPVGASRPKPWLT